MNNQLEFTARREMWNDGISLYVRKQFMMGVVFAEPLVLAPPKEEGDPIEPFITIDIQAAQQLMDELWQCGLRPSEGTGSAGSLAATQKHLQDMRTIVGKQLKVPFK